MRDLFEAIFLEYLLWKAFLTKFFEKGFFKAIFNVTELCF